MGAAGRKRARKIVDDDDDADDIPARVGRPRAAEQFGPPKSEPHEREEFATRLNGILAAIEIPALDRAERMYLQRILWRTDRMGDIDPRRFSARGEDQIIPLLRAIFETTNGIAALRLSIMKTVGSCLQYDAWKNRGLELLEAMDQVPLVEIQTTLQGLGLEEHLDKAIRWRLTQILGSPFAPPAKPRNRPRWRSRQWCRKPLGTRCCNSAKMIGAAEK